MPFQDFEYTHSPNEIEEMSRLLKRSGAVSLKPFNWRLALFENWIYASRYLEPPEYFTSRVHLWRNERGELDGFIIRGYSFVNIQVDYAQRALEPQIFEWAEQHFAGEDGQVRTMVYDWDRQRQRLLKKHGYQNLGPVEDVRIYDLSRPIPPAVLPPGFRFTSQAEFADVARRVDLENRVWGMDLTEAWFRGKRSAPSYSYSLDLLVLSPEGRPAAYSLVWLYPDNQSAEIDPIGTHPDFRRLGLSRALVLESFRRMQASGICFAYIASETDDPIVSHLYSSFHPAEFYQGYLWMKQVSQDNNKL